MDDMLVRRVNGQRPPTERQGKDGQWKKFHSITKIAVGIPVVITWEIVNGTHRATATSDVTIVR